MRMTVACGHCRETLGLEVVDGAATVPAHGPDGPCPWSGEVARVDTPSGPRSVPAAAVLGLIAGLGGAGPRWAPDTSRTPPAGHRRFPVPRSQRRPR
jgi:hypothetical protein